MSSESKSNYLAGAGSFIGDLGNIITNIATGHGSAYRSYKYSKKLQKFNYKLQREARQTAFQDTRQSLEEAGYNPLLAVGEQAQGLTPSGTVSGEGSTYDVAGAFAGITSALSAKKQAQTQEKRNEVLNQNETEIKDANIAETNAKIGLINQQAENQRIENSIQSALGLKRMETEIDKMASEAGLNRQQVENLKEGINVAKTEQLKNVAMAGQANAGTAQLSSATSAQNLENTYMSDFIDWLENHPNQRKIHFFNKSVGNIIRDVAVGVGSIGAMGKLGKIDKAVTGIRGSIKYKPHHSPVYKGYGK